jgi:hypothetical protein
MAKKTKSKESAPAPVSLSTPAMTEKPKYSFPTEEYESFKMFDDEAWRFFEPLFIAPDGGQSAEAVAELFLLIAWEIEKGPAGARRAAYTLKDAVRFIYRYTTANRAALQLFVAFATGDLPPEDEPLNLIGGALKRAGVVRKAEDVR